MSNRRAVITGMGAITPVGLNVADTWQSLVAGRSGVRTVTQFDISEFPTKFAAEVRDFDPCNYMDFKSARRTARFTQFSVAATQEAVRASALDFSKEDMTRVGISLGTAIGGILVIEEQIRIFSEKGYRRINPTVLPILLANSPACHVAISLGVKGPTTSPVAACATGVVAVGEALRHLQSGRVEVMLAGGSDAAVSPLGMAAFARIGATSTRNDEPEKACRPFDAERDGTVMGEGAVVLTMETLDHARRRNAPILAEVLGFGLTEDAYHIAAPDPTGDGAARAMSLALADAGLSPDDVDYIVPHGTGTPLNDVAETRACRTAFGERAYRIPISSNKSVLGHMLGAAGAVSTMVAVQAIREGIMPPTINLEHPDPDCDLDYVPRTAREARVDVAIANGFGFGGQNATVVVRGVDER